MSNKPALGVLSNKYYYKFLEDEISIKGGMSLNELERRGINRINNLKEAIVRKLEAKEEVNPEWVIEYNTLVEKRNNDSKMSIL